MNADRRAWVIPREGQIELRDLTVDDVLVLEHHGFERFTIGRGQFAPIVGYAEDAGDVGQLRRILNRLETERPQSARDP